MSKKRFWSRCTQLFMRIFMIDVGCFFISFFILGINSGALARMLVQLACIIVLISIIYSYMHKQGDSDAVLINSGYNKASMLRGLYIGLIVNIPFSFAGVLLVLSRLGVVGTYMNMYKIINSFFFPFLFTIMPTDLTIMDIPALDIILSLSILLVIPILSMFSYMLGLYRFSFNEHIFYKKKKNEI